MSGTPNRKRSIQPGQDARPLAHERVFSFPGVARLLLAALVVGVLAAGSPFAAAAQEATPAVTPTSGDPIARGASWLAAQQADDGGWVGFSGTSDPGATADAVIALAAARAAGTEVDLAAAVAYLEANALVYAQSGAGQAAKLVLAVVAAGGDPRNVAGVDPLSLAEKGLDPETGFYGMGVYDHALVMLALAAAGGALPPEAIEQLDETQLKDGSWSFDGSEVEGAGDSNTTAVVIQALVAAGQGENSMVRRGLEYLAAAQDEGGGFPFQPNPTALADANSTALAVQAIVAAGQDPASTDWKNAAGALLAFQNESGAFRYQEEPPDDNLFATTQALPAAAGMALPITGETASRAPALFGLAGLRGPAAARAA